MRKDAILDIIHRLNSERVVGVVSMQDRYTELAAKIGTAIGAVRI